MISPLTSRSRPANRRFRPVLRVLAGVGIVGAGVVALVGPARLIAQIEGERGIAPVVNTGNIEVAGIEVNTTGPTAAQARLAGWKQAEHLAWAQTHGPQLDDATIDGLVSAVVVEQEEIGPHRYHARLRVVFDRARAGQYVAGQGGAVIRRSAPMLVIPVLYSGGVSQVFEVRGAWQRAWAEGRLGTSAIDYVRPSGGGGDSLLLTAGQPGRRSRMWWHAILDQFGAADVLVPTARLERQWPGGPIHGTFTARYGPDNSLLGSFTLDAADEAALPAMLAQAVGRIDSLYVDALSRGALRPDTSLTLEHPGTADPGISGLIQLGREQAAAEKATAEAQAASEAAQAASAASASAAAAVAEIKGTVAVTVQFASPDARSVDVALAALRGTSGISNAATTSIAIGGVSVMRATYVGQAAELAAALRARGWQVSQTGSVLHIRR